MPSFCRKTCVRKIPRFRGGYFGFGGGGECRFYLWARGFFVLNVVNFGVFSGCFQSETPEPLRNTANGIFQQKKSVDFPPWGLLTFPENPVICAAERRFPHHESGKIIAESCSGLRSFRVAVKVGTPPTSYRSQKPPRLEKSKKSLRGSLRGVSEGSRPTPPKRVRNESPGDSVSRKSPVFLTPETRF